MSLDTFLLAMGAPQQGANPLLWICEALGAFTQLSLKEIVWPSEARTSVSCGFMSGFAMPNCASDGPFAVITTSCGPVPAARAFRVTDDRFA